MFGLIGIGLGFMAELELGKEMKREELRERWKNLQNLPRKKKKREKKHLLLIWAILEYDPIEQMLGYNPVKEIMNQK